LNAIYTGDYDPSVVLTQGRQPLGRLSLIDRTGEILSCAIIGYTSFATDMINGPEQAAFAIRG